jgi:hypothetical protein
MASQPIPSPVHSTVDHQTFRALLAAVREEQPELRVRYIGLEDVEIFEGGKVVLRARQKPPCRVLRGSNTRPWRVTRQS